MSFYPMTVNYWTMRESSSEWKGKETYLLYGFFGKLPGQTAFSSFLEKDSVWVFLLYINNNRGMDHETSGWRDYGQ